MAGVTMPTRDPVVVTPAALRDWPLPGPGGDKESRGEILVVGGTSSTPGAVLLAGESSLRAGGGKLRIATAEPVVGALAVAVPEAMLVGLPHTADGFIAEDAADLLVALAAGASTVLVGPGFTDPEATVGLLSVVLPRLDSTVVVDAIATAYLTDEPDGLAHLAGRAVVTMNPKELARTAHLPEEKVHEDPLTPAAAVAERTNAVVVCGGEQKLVVAPDGRAWLVQGGGPGLGVSGSGDVQSGIVAGLCARGADPAQAAVWGTYLHGRAGERLAASVGTVGYLARELPPQVPSVLSELA